MRIATEQSYRAQHSTAELQSSATEQSYRAELQSIA